MMNKKEAQKELNKIMKGVDFVLDRVDFVSALNVNNEKEDKIMPNENKNKENQPMVGIILKDHTMIIVPKRNIFTSSDASKKYVLVELFDKSTNESKVEKVYKDRIHEVQFK